MVEVPSATATPRASVTPRNPATPAITSGRSLRAAGTSAERNGSTAIAAAIRKILERSRSSRLAITMVRLISGSLLAGDGDEDLFERHRGDVGGVQLGRV